MTREERYTAAMRKTVHMYKKVLPREGLNPITFRLILMLTECEQDRLV